MDLPRAKAPRKRALVALAVVGGVAAAAGGSVGLSRLAVAAPSVKRAGLWLDTVQRGELVREVRGPGSLVPEQLRFVTAAWPARVVRLNVKGGEPVGADTVLLELDNPDLTLQALEAERQLASAHAALVDLSTQGQSAQLTLEGALETLSCDAADAARQAASSEQLAAVGLASAQERAHNADKQHELAERLTLERRRKQVLAAGLQQQLNAQRQQVERLRAVAEFRRAQVDALKVRAGEAGVVQEVQLQPGQWVTAGQTLAKVARPDALKAELRISEAQARDVALGQRVLVDTHQGTARGVVSRIDPSVTAGAVKVDVSLEGPLPKGARPDLSVDGTIELERLADVLYVGRPAFAAEGASQLFRVEGSTATRVPVVLGKSSVTKVEVVRGLAEGDEVILSDLSQVDSNERLELK